MSQEYTGGCDCGAVTYRITGPVRMAVNCHCSACRRRNGAAFSTYCVAPEEAFEIVRGEESLTSYAASEVGSKHFCSQCGTPVFNVNARYPGVCMVHYGTLAEHGQVGPRFNIFCESKLEWVDGVSALRSYQRERGGG